MRMDLTSTKSARMEEVGKCDLSQETTEQQKRDRKKRKFKQKKPKHRRARHRPYAAKNFLGRPKINAPANTTQFLFNDKYCCCEESQTKNASFADRLSSAGTNSESESSLNTSSSTQQPDLPNGSTIFDEYKFCAEDFDQMYDDYRAEVLRNESVEELSARCVELESAVHNLRYLLKRETEKRKKMEEIVCLQQINKSLQEENTHLQQNSSVSLTLVSQASSITLDDKMGADNALHIPEYVGS